MKLEEHEYICSKCDGGGFIFHKVLDCSTICGKCLGSGKVNWIENILGKKQTLPPKVDVGRVMVSSNTFYVYDGNDWLEMKE